MPDFVLEIGCEEIPARMIDAASLELCKRVSDLISRERLGGGTIDCVATPRRLAVVASGVASEQPYTIEHLNGPSVGIAYKDGKPTAAADAFARKAGVEVSQLQRVTTPKGEYLTAEITKKGRAAIEVLSQLLPKEINSVYWPKNMYWRKPSEKFVRPVRWLVALLDTNRVGIAFLLLDRFAFQVRAPHTLKLCVPPRSSIAPSANSESEKNSMPLLAQFRAHVGARIKFFWTRL